MMADDQDPLERFVEQVDECKARIKALVADYRHLAGSPAIVGALLLEGALDVIDDNVSDSERLEHYSSVDSIVDRRFRREAIKIPPRT